MRRKFIFLALLIAIGCSRLSVLTPATLEQAENRWNSSRPGLYHLTVEVTGDRVPAGTFEVMVQDGQVTSFRRNGQVLKAENGQAYSMEGLFRTLHQELVLAEKPTLLGAPEGYTVYTLARFDDVSGRLVEYRRTVGGTNNSIDIRVRQFDLPAQSKN